MLPTIQDNAGFGSSFVNGNSETISIDLSGTILSFRLPEGTLQTTDYLHGFARDLRPFVNTISKSEYSYDPTTQRGCCTFYETGWRLFAKKKRERQNLGLMRLSCDLETMHRDEYDVFPNLFNESCLRDWLALYYRDREAILDHARIMTQEDGSLVIEFLDEGEVPSICPDLVPLQKLPEIVAGMPCYFIYLKRGVIEFNLSITKRDVLQMHFKLVPEIEDKSMRSQLSHEFLAFAYQVMSTITIKFSERSLNEQREANALPYKNDGLLGE